MELERASGSYDGWIRSVAYCEPSEMIRRRLSAVHHQAIRFQQVVLLGRDLGSKRQACPTIILHGGKEVIGVQMMPGHAFFLPVSSAGEGLMAIIAQTNIPNVLIAFRRTSKTLIGPNHGARC